MAGKLPPETVKPVPVVESELIVTAAVPLEVTVTDFVTAVPTATLPKDSDVALRLSAAVAAFSCRETDFEVLPVEAVSVADCAVVTEATLAVNDVLVAVAGTVTELGSVTEPLLLASPTLTPPVGAAPDRLTVHESASEPVIEVLPQEIALTVGITAVPLPLTFTVAVGAVLKIDSCPDTELAVVGRNCTVSTVDWPGLSVAGKPPPVTVKPVPVIESELIVTATVPLDVTVTGFVIAEPTATLPKASDVVLTVTPGVAAFSCSPTLCDEELALADTVAVCEVLTEEMVALKEAVVAPLGTVTLLGTFTALLLLVKVTPKPADGAPEVSDTVHDVVAAPVKELLAHDTPLTEGVNSELADPETWIEADFEADPCFAVSVTVCVLDTADTVAVNVTPVVPAGTGIEEGTVTALLLLVIVTATPPDGAGALNLTVQLSGPGPVIDEFAQLRADSEACAPLP